MKPVLIGARLKVSLFLHWLAGVVELFVCLCAGSFFAYLGYMFAFGSPETKARLRGVLTFVHQNWIPFVFLLLLMFFSSLKQILLRAKSLPILGGMEPGSQDEGEEKKAPLKEDS